MTEEDDEELKDKNLLDEIYIYSMRIHSYLHILHGYTELEQENSEEVFNINEIVMLCVKESDKIFDLYHKYT